MKREYGSEERKNHQTWFPIHASHDTLHVLTHYQTRPYERFLMQNHENNSHYSGSLAKKTDKMNKTKYIDGTTEREKKFQQSSYNQIHNNAVLRAFRWLSESFRM